MSNNRPPLTPNFVPGVGKLVTTRYDFEQHITGANFRHNAGMIDLSPTVVIGGNTISNVQDAIITITGLLVPPVIPSATIGTNSSNLGLITLGGDIGGSALIPIVTAFQGYKISSLPPSTGNVLTWNGLAWAPAGLSATFNSIATFNNTADFNSLTNFGGITDFDGTANFNDAVNFNGIVDFYNAVNIETGPLSILSGAAFTIESGSTFTIASGSNVSLNLTSGSDMITLQGGADINLDSACAINMNTGSTLKLMTGSLIDGYISWDATTINPSISQIGVVGMPTNMSISAQGSTNFAGGNLDIASGSSAIANYSSINMQPTTSKGGVLQVYQRTGVINPNTQNLENQLWMSATSTSVGGGYVYFFSLPMANSTAAFLTITWMRRNTGGTAAIGNIASLGVNCNASGTTNGDPTASNILPNSSGHTFDTTIIYASYALNNVSLKIANGTVLDWQFEIKVLYI